MINNPKPNPNSTLPHSNNPAPKTIEKTTTPRDETNIMAVFPHRPWWFCSTFICQKFFFYWLYCQHLLSFLPPQASANLYYVLKSDNIDRIKQLSSHRQQGDNSLWGTKNKLHVVWAWSSVELDTLWFDVEIISDDQLSLMTPWG